MKHKYLAKRYWKSFSTPMSEVVELSKKYTDMINLSLGDPDYITDSKIIDATYKDTLNGHTRYTNSLGDEELREEIIKFYKEEHNFDLAMKEVMAVVGGCHAMFLILEAILDEGDEVIIHEPYFTPYYNQIKLAKGKPVILKTYEEDDFQINVDKLKKLINERTRAVVINSPNNPTGACFSKETLEEIAKLAKEQDLIIITDEVYDAFSFDKPFIPFASLEDMKQRTITIGSFSKDYAMTGWRIGYVLAEDYIINTIRDINEGVCFTAPSISQRAALHALRLRKDVQPQMLEEYRKRIYYAYDRIKNIPKLSVMYPKGSIYLFVNIKETGLSSVDFCMKLMEEAHVLALPGTAFGDSGEGYIRITCTVSIDEFKEAFDRIEKVLNC